MSFSAVWKQKKQQSNAPGFMPVNSSNSVELEILQVGETLNEQLSGRLANHHAVFQVAYTSLSVWFTVSVSMLGRLFMALVA